MAPKSRYEVMIGKVLMRIGINIVRDSYVLPRWYGEKAIEIDFVTTFRNATILIEVSANEMLDVRHLRRKDIKMWDTHNVIDKVCADLGIPRTNHTRIVYMSIATEGSFLARHGRAHVPAALETTSSISSRMSPKSH